jgi:hypothetical protein
MDGELRARRGPTPPSAAALALSVFVSLAPDEHAFLDESAAALVLSVFS